MKIFKILVAILFLSGVGIAQNTEKIYRASVSDDGIQRVEIESGEYFFEPEYIVVKANVPVEIVITEKPGIVPHNIVIDAPEAGMTIREKTSSKPKIIKFTPTKLGNYSFVCDKKLLFFKSHREKGMEGILEVIE